MYKNQKRISLLQYENIRVNTKCKKIYEENMLKEIEIMVTAKVDPTVSRTVRMKRECPYVLPRTIWQKIRFFLRTKILKIPYPPKIIIDTFFIPEDMIESIVWQQNFLARAGIHPSKLIIGAEAYHNLWRAERKIWDNQPLFPEVRGKFLNLAVVIHPLLETKGMPLVA